MMAKTIILIGAVASALAVAVGAFGAHALKDLLAANNRLDVFETASKYHFYHALGLVLLGLLMLQAKAPHSLLQASAWAMLAGIVIFSGSLYALAITNIGKLGAITPIGGVAFIVAWGLLAWAAVKGF